MFKRGGSTQGTGIMSHVEPRVKAASGFGFLFPGQNRQPLSQQQIDAFKAANERPAPNFQMSDLFPRLDPNYDQKVKEYGSILAYNRAQKEKLAPLKDLTGVEIGMMGDDGITKYDQTAMEQEAQKIAQGTGIEQLEQAGLYKMDKITPPASKKEQPKYVGTDIKSEVENESKMIRELLKDEQYSKGELALLVAGALKEPGGIAEKLDKARELALPIARKRRGEDKAITLAAYKLAKEKEQQEIKAGTSPKELKILRAGAEAEAKRTGGDAKKIYQERLAKFGGLDETTQRSINSLLQGRGEVQRLVNDIKDARKRKQKAASSGKDTSKIDTELEEYTSEFNTIKNSLGFEFAYPELVGFKEGGRVNRAMGSDEDGETSDIITSNVSFGGDEVRDETVVEKPVEKMDYRTLRDRLPPEITDQVVQLLAGSEEALQDFAYISTQEDVNKFNVKHGVNLVMPPAQA
jgi:hypothetical protein